MSRDGFRGYVAARPLFGGERAPQHVQNIVIRDHARRRGLKYLLSAVEYTMPGCYQMLETVLDGATSLQGIIAYGLFMMPEDTIRRRAVYERILACGAELHFAVEDLVIRNRADIGRIEDIWLLQKLLAAHRQGK
ncbi:sporadic carbohydrate cluster protein, TIGR04323 family [Magnetospirillum sp. ME-1]|uniref:LIC12192 family sporadic carbohydrate cluster protein n=1 Tax=Magnetospirillum sp. ME-1 TaxID=1639348 RepID=UPI000A17AAFD|nr:LIC12192 family sporadic carbohydrate cluster protein [Magnetospirillum sp. ME-1]ARJ66513.1 sporadic carbohydrate cluster protein, TIGR04323 family [Magnetospirillum sp. ME-1]